MLMGTKGICELVAAWFDFLFPSDIQSNYKAKKMPFVFWILERNREFEVLCSCHSIAVASAC